MVRSMLSNSCLPVSLWMYGLKIAMYLLNMVPSKVVQKTPFELWMSRKPSLRHLHVWGCQAEVRIYNLQEKKIWWKNNQCIFNWLSRKIKRVYVLLSYP